MKKLELKNLKVVKLTNEEKTAVKGGLVAQEWDTSNQCNVTSHPYVSWCNKCPQSW